MRPLLKRLEQLEAGIRPKATPLIRVTFPASSPYPKVDHKTVFLSSCGRYKIWQFNPAGLTSHLKRKQARHP